MRNLFTFDVDLVVVHFDSDLFGVVLGPCMANQVFEAEQGSVDQTSVYGDIWFA